MHYVTLCIFYGAFHTCHQLAIHQLEKVGVRLYNSLTCSIQKGLLGGKIKIPSEMQICIRGCDSLTTDIINWSQFLGCFWIFDCFVDMTSKQLANFFFQIMPSNIKHDIKANFTSPEIKPSIISQVCGENFNPS